MICVGRSMLNLIKMAVGLAVELWWSLKWGTLHGFNGRSSRMCDIVLMIN